jgi:hypothetical protein
VKQCDYPAGNIILVQCLKIKRYCVFDAHQGEMLGEPRLYHSV